MKLPLDLGPQGIFLENIASLLFKNEKQKDIDNHLLQDVKGHIFTAEEHFTISKIINLQNPVGFGINMIDAFFNFNLAVITAHRILTPGIRSEAFEVINLSIKQFFS